MTAKIYIASHEVIAGQEHLFLLYDPNLDSDNDPSTGSGMQILRAGRPANHGIDGVPNNIVVEVKQDAMESVDWLFPFGATTLSQNFRMLYSDFSATTIWNNMRQFALSMGDDNYADPELYDTGIDYNWYGPNSNAVINTLLNVVGADLRDNTPFADGSPTIIQDPSEFPGHLHLVDGGGNSRYTAYIYNSGVFETTVFHKRGGNDTISLEWNSLIGAHAKLEINNDNNSTGLTTVYFEGLNYSDASFSSVASAGNLLVGHDSEIILQVKDFYLDRANDASEGTRTTAFEFEDIVYRRGSNRDDVLDATTSKKAVRLEGFGGTDTLIGGYGDDYIKPGEGVKTISGGIDPESDWDVLDLSYFTAPMNLNLWNRTYESGSSSGIYTNIEEIRLADTNNLIKHSGVEFYGSPHMIIDAGDGYNILETKYGFVTRDVVYLSEREIHGIDEIRFSNIGNFNEASSLSILELGLTYSTASGYAGDAYFSYANYTEGLTFNLNSSGNSYVTDGTDTDTFSGITRWNGVGTNYGDTINGLFALRFVSGTGNDTISTSGGLIRYTGGSDTIFYNRSSPTSTGLQVQFVQPSSIVSKVQTLTGSTTSGGIKKEYWNIVYTVSGVGTVTVEGLEKHIRLSGNVTLRNDLSYVTQSYNAAPIVSTVGDSNIVGTGNDAYGGLGNDIISNTSGYMYGSFGDDELYGGAGNNRLYGGAGNDTLSGGEGIDYYYGGSGDDILIAGNELDYFYGGHGYDILDFSSTSTAIKLSSVDGFWSYAFSNTYRSITGIEQIKGTAHADSVSYSPDNTTLMQVDGGGGDDTLTIALTSSNFYSSIEAIIEYKDALISGPPLAWFKFDGMELEVKSIENLKVLVDNKETIVGTSGNDTLTAGAGFQNLYGGEGSDIFEFALASLGGVADRILDFSLSDGDKIDISDLLQAYDPLTHAISDFVHMSTYDGNTIISIDSNGPIGGGSYMGTIELAGVTGMADVNTLVSNGTLIVA